MSDSTHLDVLIIGAGLSGIDAAYHVTKAFPDKSYAVLEMRDSLDRKSTRLNSSHVSESRMPSSA